MTNPLAEQVAGLKPGEWVEARFANKYGSYKTEGGLYSHGDWELALGEDVIKYREGALNSSLTSITRVPRPIPSEPEVGSFALLDVSGDKDIVEKIADFVDGWASIHETSRLTWPEIYPHIIRLYTPSGDLVEGFEYAKTEKEG